LIAFPVLGIPVRVRPSFLLIAALLGLVGTTDPVFVAAWIAIVFVSILIHELGHALTARAFGADVEIELNGIGGLTRWSVPQDSLGPGRRALIAGAGSAVGVVFGLIVWAVALQFGPYRDLSFFVINNLIFVNVFWGLLNWLPVRPLDGGHLLLSLLEKFAPSHVDLIAKVVFIATAGAGVLFGVLTNRIFIALIAGWLLFNELSSGGSRVPAGPIPEFSYDDDTEPEHEDAEIVAEEPEGDSDDADR
jgi:Zn-dependent protease